MTLSGTDRVALILGRAIIRAETLQAALEEAQAKPVTADAAQAQPNGAAAKVTT